MHVANNMVVECSGDGVEAVFPFDGEMHSMLWYDAIVLTKIDCVGRVFEDKADFFRTKFSLTTRRNPRNVFAI